jgi:hypothetical protein
MLTILNGNIFAGTCQKLKQAGDSCNHFDVMNGYCGCAPGLTCTTVHITTTTTTQPSGARKMSPDYVSYCDPLP